MIKYIYTIFCILGLLSSCDMIKSNLPIDLQNHFDEDSVRVSVVNTEILERSSKLRVGIDIKARNYNLDLTDTTNIKIKISEVMYPFEDISPMAEPKLDSVVNTASKDIEKQGLGALVMVDLSQRKEIIDRQREFVARMRTQYASHNLFVTFMLPGGDVTSIIEATPYVISNYINESSPYLESSKKIAELEVEDDGSANNTKNRPYLFRSIKTNLQQITDKEHANMSNVRKLIFVVMTDGIVYNDISNEPIDPDHFAIQQDLLEISKNFSNRLRIFFINLNSGGNEEDEEENELDNNQLHLLASRSKGAIINQMDWLELSDQICNSYNFQLTDYVLYFTQPENKIFMGSKRAVKFKIHSIKDSIDIKGRIPYRTGSIYNPDLIGNTSNFNWVIMSSMVIGLIILLLTYLIMQFAVPYGLYLWFKKKFVIFYTGINMSYRGMAIANTCYFCKAPFVTGDKIVTKCKHVVHEECWNENDGQCIEYGKRCPDGKHFYDKHNLFNPRNASFYMKWVLIAIFASTVAWGTIINQFNNSLYHLLDWVLNSLFFGGQELVENQSISDLGYISPRIYNMMVISTNVSFFLTLTLSSLVIHTHRWQHKVAECLCRALAVTFVVTILFIIGSMIVVSTNIYDGKFILDWIPWSLTGVMIAGSLVIRTRIKPRKKYLLYAAGIGAVSSLAWGMVADLSSTNYILIGIIINIAFAVGLAVLMAQQMPRHEHNMLHISGPIKEMDIALYKWINGVAQSRITIGKSVDCNISITWDIQSNIAPLAAEIINDDNRIRLQAMDEGVFFEDKPLPVNKIRTLYHGDKFKIGQTEFKYIED